MSSANRSRSMTSTAPGPHGQTLGWLLREAYRNLQEDVYNRVIAAGHPQVRTMHSTVLRHLPAEGCRAIDLARATGLAKQSIAYVITDLTRLGYLRTSPDPDDSRARRISYTKHGQHLIAALTAASQEAEAALSKRIGADAVTALRDHLETLMASAHENLPPADPAALAHAPKRRRPPGTTVSRGRLGIVAAD